MTSAFRNFFITFAICLLVFGFIGGTYVYPWLNEVLNFSDMGNESSDDSGDVSTDSSDTSDTSETSENTDRGDYYFPEGDVFTAAVLAVDENGNTVKCVFLDENAKTRQIVYCTIPSDTKFYNEIGKEVPIKNLFAVMTPEEICQCVTAMTGIKVDYCLVFDKEGVMSLADQFPGIQVKLTNPVNISYPVEAGSEADVSGTGFIDVEIANSPDGYVDLKAKQYEKTNLEWLVMYGSDSAYGAVCEALFNQFIKNENNKTLQTMTKVLNACKATNMTSEDVKTHLETIFSFDTFQLNNYEYNGVVGELDDTIQEIRDLDGSYDR